MLLFAPTILDVDIQEFIAYSVATLIISAGFRRLLGEQILRKDFQSCDNSKVLSCTKSVQVLIEEFLMMMGI